MDKIQVGAQLESLRNNDYFMSAVEAMKLSLVDQEDALIRDQGLSDDHLHTNMKRLAMMRVLLTDLVDTLDSYILEANNAQFEVESTFEQ